MIKDLFAGRIAVGRIFWLWFAPVEIAVGFILFGIIHVYVGAWYFYPSFDSMWQATALARFFAFVPMANFVWIALMIRAFWRATRIRKTETVFKIWGIGTMGLAFVINAALVVYSIKMLRNIAM